MQQVRQEYIYNKNKSYSLNDWAKFLLGKEKTLTYKELFKAWIDKDYVTIINYNANDVIMVSDLYLISQFSKLFSYAEAVGESPSENVPLTPKSAGSLKTVFCNRCLSENNIPEESKEFYCEICGLLNQQPFKEVL